MKNEKAFKAFSALTFDDDTVAEALGAASATASAKPPAGQEEMLAGSDLDSEAFRIMLLQRQNAACLVPARYRHWGINE